MNIQISRGIICREKSKDFGFYLLSSEVAVFNDILNVFFDLVVSGVDAQIIDFLLSLRKAGEECLFRHLDIFDIILHIFFHDVQVCHNLRVVIPLAFLCLIQNVVIHRVFDLLEVFHLILSTINSPTLLLNSLIISIRLFRDGLDACFFGDKLLIPLKKFPYRLILSLSLVVGNFKKLVMLH